MLIQLVAERNDTLGLPLKQTWKWRPLENEFSRQKGSCSTSILAEGYI